MLVPDDVSVLLGPDPSFTTSFIGGNISGFCIGFSLEAKNEVIFDGIILHISDDLSQ